MSKPLPSAGATWSSYSDFIDSILDRSIYRSDKSFLTNRAPPLHCSAL